MPTRPTERLLFGLEKPINDQGVLLDGGAAGAPGGTATDNRRACIDRNQSRVGKGYATAVWNAARIDGAMANTEPGTG
jgi:hypothetical protein